MSIQKLSSSLNSPIARRTILSILIGLMSGGQRVMAQTASVADPAPPVTVTPVSLQTNSATPAAVPDQADSADSAVAPETAKVDPPLDAKSAKELKKFQAKFKKKKEKKPKMTPLNIVQGTLTVDGWTGKARMNYDVADLKYLYVWAPGVGTIVVSNGFFALGKLELNAFSGNTLTIDANGHTVQLYSQKKLLNSKRAVSAYVYVDTGYQFPSAFPVMGYGATVQPPYAWPGAKNVQLATKGAVAPPPLPVNLRPTLANSGCLAKGTTNQCAVTPPVPSAKPAEPAPVAPTPPAS